MTTFTIKPLLKRILPLWLLKLRKLYYSETIKNKYTNLSMQEIFTKIYEENIWGRSTNQQQRCFSGGGSHNPLIVSTYVSSVQTALESLGEKLNVVDLGCGDFYIGSRVRALSNNYIACDIVKPLIDFNKEKFKELNVDFRVLDITKDELPDGDIVFLRQVLQHLSNKDVLAAMLQICSKYKYLVLTEHLPSSPTFVHNLDKPVGPSIRLEFDSGIVLTSPPFNLQAKESCCLCEISEAGGIIKTNLYRLA